MLSLCSFMNLSWDYGVCNSECKIEGDRKEIKLQLFAFDILKSRELL